MDFIFDFDGTLLNTKACMRSALQATLINYHVDNISDASLDCFVEDPNLLFTIDTIQSFSDEKLSDFLELYRKNYLYCRKVKADLFPHVLETLESLKRSKSKLFLVSNSNTNETFTKLKKLNIDHIFDDVIASDTLHVFKPHQFVIEHLIKTYNLDANQLAMVGDSPNDIKMAQQSGIKSFAVLTGVSSEEILQIEAPTKILKSISELKTLF